MTEIALLGSVNQPLSTALQFDHYPCVCVCTSVRVCLRISGTMATVMMHVVSAPHCTLSNQMVTVLRGCEHGAYSLCQFCCKTCLTLNETERDLPEFGG